VARSVEERLKQLEDVREIGELKAHYCNAVDCGWDGLTQDGDRLAELFVADGAWEAVPSFRLDGREAIREFFNASPFPFGFHGVTNPLIKIEGDYATGQWHMVCPCVNADKESIWYGGIYNDEFVRTADGWRFRRVAVSTAFTGKNPQGWEGSQAGG